MDISGTRIVTGVEMHESLTTMIADYNENIGYYNRNMRDIFRMFERTLNNNIARENIIGNAYISNRNSTVSTTDIARETDINRETDITGNIYISRENSSIPTVNNQRTYNTNTNTTASSSSSSNILRNPYQRTNYLNTPLNRTFNPFGGINYLDIIRNGNEYTYQDVIVRPTSEQINRATDIINWSPNMTQTNCPISLEPFQYNQPTTMIRHCGHLYNSEPLMHWFETNVRCPVCRYDIRDYNPDTNNTNQDISSNIVSYDESISDDESLPELIEDTSMDIEEPNTIIRDYIIPEPDRINNRSNLRNNINNIFNSFLYNSLDQNMSPLISTSVNELFYTLNIPLEVDISYNNISNNRNVG